jgi:hypothetical protein
MSCTFGNLDYEFVVRAPDGSVEYVIGTFTVPVEVLPGQDGEPQIVANMMLADAIFAAGRAVQAIVDTDNHMTEIVLDAE